jgi:hypothetical protein
LEEARKPRSTLLKIENGGKLILGVVSVFPKQGEKC